MILGLGHAARVGKDSLAIALEPHGFTRLSFADALRDVAYRSHPRVRAIVDDYGWEAAKITHPEVRQYLVDLGNAARIHLGEDVWVRAVENRLEPGRDYALTDVRYPNEAAWVKATGGFTVKIERPGYCPLQNIADLALADYDGWDAVVHNDGTLEDLDAKASELLCNIRQPSEVG